MTPLLSMLLNSFRLCHLLLPGILFVCAEAFSQRQQPPTALCDTDSVRVLNGAALIFLKQDVYRRAEPKAITSQFGILCRGQMLASDGFEIEEKATLYFYKTDQEFPDNYDYGLAVWKAIEPIVARIPKGEWVDSGWKYLTPRSNLYHVTIRAEKKNYRFGFFNIDGKLAFSLLSCGKRKGNSIFSSALTQDLQLTKIETHQPRYIASH